MKRFGLYGRISGDFLTYGGRILIHDNRAEMEWLVPVGSVVVRELPRDIPEEQTVQLLAHPNFEGVTRPITKEQFR